MKILFGCLSSLALFACTVDAESESADIAPAETADTSPAPAVDTSVAPKRMSLCKHFESECVPSTENY